MPRRPGVLRRALGPRRPAQEGLARARRLIDVFERADVDLVVANAAGCGSNLQGLRSPARRRPGLRRTRGRLLGEGPRRLGAPRGRGSSGRARSARPLRSRRLPGLLPPAARPARARAAASGCWATIPGLELAEPAEQELCCGSRRHLQPRPAGRRRGSSASARPRTSWRPRPTSYASANPGCLIQVTAALRRAAVPSPRSTRSSSSTRRSAACPSSGCSRAAAAELVRGLRTLRNDTAQEVRDRLPPSRFATSTAGFQSSAERARPLHLLQGG